MRHEVIKVFTKRNDLRHLDAPPPEHYHDYIMKGPENLPAEHAENKRSPLELKRAKYFSHFAAAHLKSFRLHRAHGVLAKSEGWRNVSEHCLVEGVAADVLAEALKLSDTERKNLVAAALMHDFFKRKEIAETKARGLAGQHKAEEARDKILEESGASEEIGKIVSAASDVKRMLDPDVTLPEKIMQYIDDITMNTEIRSVDERVDKVEQNPLYLEENESGREIFGGRTFSQAQRDFGHAIERELAEKIGIPPAQLPEFIREKIRQRIEQKK